MENVALAVHPQQVTEIELVKYLTAMGLAQKLDERETTQFLQIAKVYNLNPFKREIYCVKYGETLSIIVGYESYIKRAERSGLLNGWSVSTQGEVPNLKAIVTIYRKDFANPFIHEVHFSEYKQNNTFWNNKPITMIKKVAIAQAFRMCFSSEIGGMPYTAEEVVENEIPYIEVTEVLDCQEAISQIRATSTLDELHNVWKLNKKLQKEVEFIQAKDERKALLTEALKQE